MKSLAFYIHIPFCVSKCAYCNFVSDSNQMDKIDAYINAACNEITDKAKNYKNYTVNTVFLGGGTPSILTCVQISKLLNILRSNFNISPTAEITTECNPNSLTLEKLLTYKELGINRLSIGIQSLSSQTLQTMCRPHTTEQCETALTLAKESGFDNVNIDLIHSIPYNTADSRAPKYDVTTLGSFLKKHDNIKHVSLYSLILEDGTPLKTRTDKGELVESTEEESIAEQQSIEKVLKTNAFYKYEVSNFAKKGYESKHNQTYWNPQLEYLGIGLAAHSLVNNIRFSNTENLQEYIQNPTNAVETTQARATTDIINETIMLELRTTQGLNVNHLKVWGFDLLARKFHEVNELKKLNLIKLSSTNLNITATAKGFLVLNKIIEKLTI